MEKYGPKPKCSLRILGFPCNQFGYQEPGEGAEEIYNSLRFVRPGDGFKPSFPLTEKREVNGINETGLFTWLKSLCPNPNNLINERNKILYSPIRTTDITWNFAKFLIDHQGAPFKRYCPQYPPRDMANDIEKLLKDCLAENKGTQELNERIGQW